MIDIYNWLQQLVANNYSYLRPGIQIALWLIAGFIGYGLIAGLVPRVEGTLKKTTASAHHAHLLARLLQLALLFLLLTFIASNAFNINITSLLATAGIAGVAVAFAAQTSVANIISGLIMLSEDAIHIGSTIETHGVKGVVKDIGLLSMLIKKEDGTLVRIGYKTLLDKPLNILSKARSTSERSNRSLF